MKTAEEIRLEEAKSKVKPWKRWGPYLAERQWGTVREDYSESGDAWNYFTHERPRFYTAQDPFTRGQLRWPCIDPLCRRPIGREGQEGNIRQACAVQICAFGANGPIDHDE